MTLAGASDTVISVLAASVAAGKPLMKRVQFSERQAAGAVEVGNLARPTLSTIELAEAIHGSYILITV